MSIPNLLYWRLLLTGGRTNECFGNVRHVWDDGFDAVPFALDLGEQDRHAAWWSVILMIDQMGANG